MPTDEINSEIAYFPEEEPYSLNFAMCGYESKLFILNAGFPLYIIHAYLALALLYLLLKLAYSIFKCKCKCLRKSVKCLGGYLLWNSLIRVYMELYQDLSLISALNMHTVDWQSPFEWVSISNYYGLFFLILMSALPALLLLPFYCYKRDKWYKKKFRKSYGALFEGTRKKKIKKATEKE